MSAHTSTIVTAVTAATMLAGSAFAATPGPVSAPDTSARSATAPGYWTPERQRAATPMPLETYTPGRTGPNVRSAPEAPPDPSGMAPGWAPGSDEQPRSGASGSLQGRLRAAPPFTPPGRPTDYASYAPFQRFTWPGDLRQYPVSTVGKLFFSQNGKDYVCTASVIGRSTLATAGHCVHKGDNLTTGWSYNIQFCPSYGPSGADSTRGCWRAVMMATSYQWYNANNLDRDYGCIITATTGTKVAKKIGSVTGSTGRVWNLPSSQPVLAWGYPAEAPFAGKRLVTSVSTEWYQVDMNTSETQLSKYIGSDQTGGSSGGPWWLNFVGPAEVAAVDSSGVTDPSQGTSSPLLNGVNSHRRCSTMNCAAGTRFVDESGSPQFRSSAADNNDSEDVFAVCLHHANNS